jgi:hypothetical protein
MLTTPAAISASDVGRVMMTGSEMNMGGSGRRSSLGVATTGELSFEEARAGAPKYYTGSALYWQQQRAGYVAPHGARQQSRTMPWLSPIALQQPLSISNREAGFDTSEGELTLTILAMVEREKGLSLELGAARQEISELRMYSTRLSSALAESIRSHQALDAALMEEEEIQIKDAAEALDEVTSACVQMHVLLYCKSITPAPGDDPSESSSSSSSSNSSSSSSSSGSGSAGSNKRPRVPALEDGEASSGELASAATATPGSDSGSGGTDRRQLHAEVALLRKRCSQLEELVREKEGMVEKALAHISGSRSAHAQTVADMVAEHHAEVRALEHRLEAALKGALASSSPS